MLEQPQNVQFSAITAKLLKMILLTAVIGATVTKPAAAATINAASCNRTDVANAVAAAAPGDTVTIPAGTCSWTSTLNISKGITLMGAGEGRTILQDNVSKGGSTCSGGGPMIAWDVNAPQNFRMSGLKIQGVTTDPGVCQKGHVTIYGTAKAFRVDHLTMDPVQTVGIIADGFLFGLIDHVTARGDFKQKVIVRHSSWAGGSYGDGSWAEQLYWGTEKAVYIEDCTFENATQSFRQTGALDGFDGARIVFRHNTLHNESLGIHGTETSGRHRSGRSIEVYNNTVTYDAGWTPNNMTWVRGGTAVIFNNNVVAPMLNAMVHAHYCRDVDGGCGGPSFAPWGACNGSGPYDGNGNATGYRCIDQPGSGTSRLLSGDTPNPGPAQNTLDPVYTWGNTLNGAPNNVMGGSTNVQANRDYFSGVARPGYTAYVYPHPLQQGGTPSPSPTGPAAPTNLRIITGQ